MILAFLAALDEALTSLVPPTERLELYPIGRGALILFYGLGLGAGELVPAGKGIPMDYR